MFKKNLQNEFNFFESFVHFYKVNIAPSTLKDTRNIQSFDLN